MALNPYTLNDLYRKGILDYVPADIMAAASPVGSMMTPPINPYMNMAQQGALYQNYGTAQDSFHSSFTPAYTPNDYQSVSNSANSYVGINNNNNYNLPNNGMPQVGSLSNASVTNAYTGYGIGAYNNNNLANSFGEGGQIGSQSNATMENSMGGFADVKNNINNGVTKVGNAINNTPKLVLGAIAGAIGIIGIASLFKRGKKPTATHNSGMFSKLNPKNWFKHK